MLGQRVKHSYFGISDRVLFLRNGKPTIGWIGFYDYDRTSFRFPLRQMAKRLGRSILVFRSTKGVHFVSLTVTDWKGKCDWYGAFREKDPEGDYYLSRDSFSRLTPKYGKDLSYCYCESVAAAEASHIHLAAYSPFFGESLGTVRRYVYPRLVKVIGWKAKCYASDPHGVIEVASAAGLGEKP